MNSIKVIKVPVSMLPKYRGAGGIGLDVAYVLENTAGVRYCAMARSGKEWLGYTSKLLDNSYKLLPWAAKTKAEAYNLLMDEIEKRFDL